MTKNIQIPAVAVSVKAQGHVDTVDPSTFHPDSIAAIFSYGLRRWFQDNINSAAHVAKTAGDNGEPVPFDVKASFAARLAQAVSGDIHLRGSSASLDPMDKYRRVAVRQLAKSNERLAAAIKACADTEARNTLIDSIAAKNADIVDPIAKRLWDQAKATAKKAADEAAALEM